MIGLENASVQLGGRPALDRVSFSAGAGEFVAVCGPNGAGKTTLLKALAGVLPGGNPRPRDVAYVEQGATCAWRLTVTQLVALGRIPHGDRNIFATDRAIEACNLAALRSRRIDQLSGGQARRAMLARALAAETPVLLLDEPVADLDPAASHEIMALLQDLAAEGRCVVAVLHALDLATRYASRMVVMQQGRIIADDLPRLALQGAAAAFGMGFGVDLTPRLLAPQVRSRGESPPPDPGFH